MSLILKTCSFCVFLYEIEEIYELNKNINKLPSNIYNFINKGQPAAMNEIEMF